MKKRLSASFTVEITLLMPMIIGVLMAVLFVSFYLHDCAILEGAASEVTAVGVCLAWEEEQSSRVSSLADSLLNHRAMWTKSVHGSTDTSANRTSASFSGTFQYPGVLADLWTGGRVSCQTSNARTIFHPAKSIRKIRGAKYLMDAVWQ